MTGKEYLYQAIRIRRQIEHIKLRCEELSAKLGYHPIQLDDSGASKGSITDKVGDTLAELGDWEREYENQVCELKKKLDEISNMVNRVQNVRYAELLRWRYLEENKKEPTRLNSWVVIAYELGLANERVAITLHGRAIKEFEKILRSVD